MTILVCYHFGSFANFKHYYLFYIKQHLADYFPDAVSYNRFVELMPRVFFQMMLFMNLRSFGKCSGISFVDSTMIPVCHNLRRYANKLFKGVATDGKGTMGWRHGFKLHLMCNDSGEIITFCLTGANVDDRDKRVWTVFARELYGKVFADRGYIKQALFEELFDRGIHLVHGLKANMKNRLMSIRDNMFRKSELSNPSTTAAITPRSLMQVFFAKQSKALDLIQELIPDLPPSEIVQAVKFAYEHNIFGSHRRTYIKRKRH